MKNRKKALLLGAGMLVAGSLLSACSSHKEDPNTVSVGVMAGPEEQLMEVAKQVAMQRYHLNVKIIQFNDYVSPNSALADGSIDSNAFQHLPYLKATEQSRGYHFVPVGKTFIYPIGGFSSRYKSMNQLPDGATIAVPNDPSNEARSLLILAKAGLIKLSDPNSPTASLSDITDNPHHFHFDELDAAQLPRALSDVDLAFITNTYAQPAGLTLNDALIREGADSPYVNLFVVRQGEQNEEKIHHLVEAFQTEAVAERAQQLFHGGAIPGWK